MATQTDQLATSTLAVVEAFTEAFNAHDLDAVVALTTDDVVFESTSPPDGERHEGRDQVRAAFGAVLDHAPNLHFENEETIVCGERATVLWKFVFDSENPDGGHVRGVDVFTVRDGQVAAKVSYVKG